MTTSEKLRFFTRENIKCRVFPIKKLMEWPNRSPGWSKEYTGSSPYPIHPFCPICRSSARLSPVNWNQGDKLVIYTGRCWPCSNEASVSLPLRVALEMNYMLSLPVRVRRMITWSSQIPPLWVEEKYKYE